MIIDRHRRWSIWNQRRCDSGAKRRKEGGRHVEGLRGDDGKSSCASSCFFLSLDCLPACRLLALSFLSYFYPRRRYKYCRVFSFSGKESRKKVVLAPCRSAPIRSLAGREGGGRGFSLPLDLDDGDLWFFFFSFLSPLSLFHSPLSLPSPFPSLSSPLPTQTQTEKGTEK